MGRVVFSRHKIVLAPCIMPVPRQIKSVMWGLPALIQAAPPTPHCSPAWDTPPPSAPPGACAVRGTAPAPPKALAQAPPPLGPLAGLPVCGASLPPPLLGQPRGAPPSPRRRPGLPAWLAPRPLTHSPALWPREEGGGSGGEGASPPPSALSRPEAAAAAAAAPAAAAMTGKAEQSRPRPTPVAAAASPRGRQQAPRPGRRKRKGGRWKPPQTRFR